MLSAKVETIDKILNVTFTGVNLNAIIERTMLTLMSVE